MIKQSVPHFFTSLNLLSGCFSIYFAYIFQFETAFVFILAGVFFDMWDGLLARLLGVESELGVQLDSMADMVTSGLACLLYTSPSPRDATLSRMPSSA